MKKSDLVERRKEEDMVERRKRFKGEVNCSRPGRGWVEEGLRTGS